MGTAWRYRLFRSGKLPEALREAADGALFVAEGVSVKSTAKSIRLPVLRAGASYKLLVGGAVVRPDHLLLSIGTAVIVDGSLAGPGRIGQTVTFAADGIHLHTDVSSVYGTGTSGTVDLHYRVALDPTLLAQLPTAPIPVALEEILGSMLRGWL